MADSETIADLENQIKRLTAAYNLADIRRREAEKAASEIKADLEASREVVQDLLKQISELNREISDGRTKDAMIEALKRRVKNITEEYNDKHWKIRRTTTLADVKKLTGES